MKEFRILIDGNIYLGDWSSCENVSIEYMQRLAERLNRFYGNNWQVIYRG